MKTRPLGRTGAHVSALCLGTMSFGGEADEAGSAALFARARDAGIDVFDCADVYNGGRSEEILGRLVAGHRDEVVLATKAHFPTGPGRNDRGSSRLHLFGAVEASLRRLATDRIDLYYLHRFDERTPLEESLRALEDMVRQGKILYPAVSNFAAWQIARALGIAERHGWAPVAAVQPMFNLAKRQAEVEILPMAQTEGLAVFPYSPLGGGLLSGKYGVDTDPAAGRLVHNDLYRRRYADPAHRRTAAGLVALAREAGCHPATLAVAWVAAHPAVTAPILGARSVEQLEPSLAAADFELTPELRARLDALSPTPPPATDRTEETLGLRYGEPGKEDRP